MSRFEIVLSRHGRHVATCDLKAADATEAARRFDMFCHGFPPRDGYTVELMEWPLPLGRSIRRQERLK